jgi:hypothetical protein
MTRNEWLALAERCEKATGPDDRLSFAIDELLFAPRRIRGFKALAPYTASLDAITALIERELPGWAHCHIQEKLRGCIGYIHNNRNFHDTQQRWHECRAATPALALCAAFAKAMAEKVGAR